MEIRKERTTAIAYTLYKADDEYRGFGFPANPPKDANYDWYFENIEGWPWYFHMAEKVLDMFE
jgi:hypothetical protein